MEERLGAPTGARVASAIPVPPAPTARAPGSWRRAVRGDTHLVPPSAGVRRAASVPDRGVAKQRAGDGCWLAAGEEARSSGEGLSMAPAAGNPVPGLGLAAAEPELALPCRFGGDNVAWARGIVLSPCASSCWHHPAALPTIAGGRCRCPRPRGLAGAGAGVSPPFCLALCRGGTGSGAGQGPWQHVGGDPGRRARPRPPHGARRSHRHADVLRGPAGGRRGTHRCPVPGVGCSR